MQRFKLIIVLFAGLVAGGLISKPGLTENGGVRGKIPADLFQIESLQGTLSYKMKDTYRHIFDIDSVEPTAGMGCFGILVKLKYAQVPKE